MKNNKTFASRIPKYIVIVLTMLYFLYFAIFSIQRMNTLYSSYYDLGIMHQTVYNTFRAVQTFDFHRILEMTNTEGPGQVTRMAIHNDLLLAPLAVFYFIYASPITLLVIQTLVLALGALVIYKLAQSVLSESHHRNIVGAVFAAAWLLYVPMERSNIYDFHAVVLSTTFLLCMYYFWVIKKYRLSFLFFFLSIISKEEVALTTTLFGIYALIHAVRPTLFFGPVRYFKKIKHLILNDKSNLRYSLTVSIVSIMWFALSVFVIIPFFRGGYHFATTRYGEFGESPSKIIAGIVQNPFAVVSRLVHNDAGRYIYLLMGPLGFLSFLSPIHLLIVIPEFAINLLSNSGNMRNIIFHYTAVIQPFVFISALYGFKRVTSYELRVMNWKIVSIYILIVSLMFSYTKSPLWFSKEHEIHPFVYPQKESIYVKPWSKILNNDTIKVSTTGQLAPFFTSRRYFYNFSKYYYLADYVIIRPNEVFTYSDKDVLIPVYQSLVKDTRFMLIDKKENFEVYKKK